MRLRPQSIHITSDPPGAAVYLGGKLVEGTTTPTGTLILKDKIPAGEYDFVFRLPGYVEKVKRVRVLANGRTHIDAELTRLGRLSITTDAPCVLSLTPTDHASGEDASSAERRTERFSITAAGQVELLRPGSYEYICNSEHYKPSGGEVTVRSNETENLRISQHPLPVGLTLKSDLTDIKVAITRSTIQGADCPERPKLNEDRDVVTITDHQGETRLPGGAGWYCATLYNFASSNYSLEAKRHFTRAFYAPHGDLELRLDWKQPPHTLVTGIDEILRGYIAQLSSLKEHTEQCLSKGALSRDKRRSICRQTAHAIYVAQKNHLDEQVTRDDKRAFVHLFEKMREKSHRTLKKVYRRQHSKDEVPESELSEPLWLQACEMGDVDACEIASIMRVQRNAPAHPLLKKACDYGRTNPCLRFAEIKGWERGVSQLIEAARFYKSTDSNDETRVQLFAAGDIFGWYDTQPVMVGFSFLSLDFENFGAPVAFGIRTFSPMFVTYRQRIADSEEKSRYAVGIEVAAGSFRWILADPFYLELGLDFEAYQDTGLGRFKLAPGFSGGLGFSRKGWGLLLGTRMVDVSPYAVSTEDAELRSLEYQFVPYMTVRTNLSLVK